MKKTIIFTFIMFTFFFTGCGEGAQESYKPTASLKSVKVYKFAVHPYLNSKKMYTSYRPILDHIETQIGDIKIILETSPTYADYNVKLYRGDFDISLPNPFQTYNALSYNYKVYARMKPDSVFRGIFVARKSLHLKNPKQLIGKKVSFPAPTALAATMMPLYYLYEHGIDLNKDITQKYVGSQYSSILNAYTLDTAAAATWSPPWESWKKENPQKALEMEVVWETKSLINNAIVIKKDMDEKLAQRIVAILVNLDTTKDGKKLLANAGFEGFQNSKDEDFNVVADFLKNYDKAIGIPK